MVAMAAVRVAAKGQGPREGERGGVRGRARRPRRGEVGKRGRTTAEAPLEQAVRAQERALARQSRVRAWAVLMYLTWIRCLGIFRKDLDSLTVAKDLPSSALSNFDYGTTVISATDLPVNILKYCSVSKNTTLETFKSLIGTSF